MQETKIIKKFLVRLSKKKGEAFSGKDREKLRKEQITPSSAKHTMIIVVHRCSFRFDYVVQFMIIFIMCT